MSILEFKEVSKSYVSPNGETLRILNSASLQIQAGDTIAITGPSGCGKSTVLNLLGTLDEADSGDILWLGQKLPYQDANAIAALRREQLGFIFQMHHLLPQCTVLENVLLPVQALVKPNWKEAKARALHLLERVGLSERLHSLPSQLSGGERQRTAVVRALINQPKLLLADEPTGALDANNAQLLIQLLLELSREQGVALVLVTHNPEQASLMQRVLLLKQGKFEQMA